MDLNSYRQISDSFEPNQFLNIKEEMTGMDEAKREYSNI